MIFPSSRPAPPFAIYNPWEGKYKLSTQAEASALVIRLLDEVKRSSDPPLSDLLVWETLGLNLSKSWLSKLRSATYLPSAKAANRILEAGYQWLRERPPSLP